MEGWDKAVVDVVGAVHRQWSSLHPHFLPHPEFIPQKHTNWNDNELNSVFDMNAVLLEGWGWITLDEVLYIPGVGPASPDHTAESRGSHCSVHLVPTLCQAVNAGQAQAHSVRPALQTGNPAKTITWFPRAQMSFSFCDLTRIQINHQKPPLSSCYSLSLSVLENTSLPSSSSPVWLSSYSSTFQ